MKDYLIQDINHLSNDDVSKLYKYVRRYLIAKIDGLIDPLEPSALKKMEKLYEERDELRAKLGRVKRLAVAALYEYDTLDKIIKECE